MPVAILEVPASFLGLDQPADGFLDRFAELGRRGRVAVGQKGQQAKPGIGRVGVRLAAVTASGIAFPLAVVVLVLLEPA